VVNASVWVIFALPLIVMLLLGFPAIGWAITTGHEPTVVATVYVVVMLMLLTWLLKMTLDGIFSAVTYRYVSERQVDPHFDEEALRLAFRNRPNRLVNRVRRWLGRDKLTAGDAESAKSREAEEAVISASEESQA
jgi:hypothetical protein